MSPQEKATWESPQIDEWTRPDNLAQRKYEDLSGLPQTVVVGTGFFVAVVEPRMSADKGVGYLITNRHVAQPGVEESHPCTVLFNRILMNHKGISDKAPVTLQSMWSPARDWFVPSDDSVDLAALRLSPNNKEWDFQAIPEEFFVTPEMIAERQVVEGDPVLFAGLFIQYSGRTQLEPIIRSGAIAMLPRERIETTLHRPGTMYLAETHSYGGNSGSPMIVDTAPFSNLIGHSYRFFGVVAGSFNETNDFQLQVNVVYKGSVQANSGVSAVVPAEEVRKLLHSPSVVKDRDQLFANQKKP